MANENVGYGATEVPGEGHDWYDVAPGANGAGQQYYYDEATNQYYPQQNYGEGYPQQGYNDEQSQQQQEYAYYENQYVEGASGRPHAEASQGFAEDSITGELNGYDAPSVGSITAASRQDPTRSFEDFEDIGPGTIDQGIKRAGNSPRIRPSIGHVEETNNTDIKHDTHVEDAIQQQLRTDIEILRPRRALAIGFGGQVLRSAGSSIWLSAANEFSPLAAEGSSRLDSFDLKSFKPLLTMCVESAVANEELEAIAVDLSTRGDREAFPVVDDGDLPGSTKLLWEAIAALVKCRGKRAEGLLSSGPPIGTFDRKLLDLLSGTSLEEVGDAKRQQIQEYFFTSASIARLSQSQESTALVELEALLTKGDQEAAVSFAVRSGLWAHALIIAHYISASCYRRVVSEFTARTLPADSSMFLIFQMLAGRGIDAIQSQSSPYPSTWKNTLQSILANRSPNDVSVLTTFGDKLWADTRSVSAAHLCYLAAGHSPLQAEDRVMLVGGDHTSPRAVRSSFVTPGAIMRTEAYLFARSLKTPASPDQAAVKAFQPFRLVFAMWLADMGYTEQAKDWIKSIKQVVSGRDHNSNIGLSDIKDEDADWVFLEQLDMFDARLNGRQVPQAQIQEAHRRKSLGGSNAMTAGRPSSFVARLEHSLLVDTPSTPLVPLKPTVEDLPPPHFDFFSPSSPSAPSVPRDKGEPHLSKSPATVDEPDEKEWANPFGAAKNKLAVPRKLELTAPPTPPPPGLESTRSALAVKSAPVGNGETATLNPPSRNVAPPKTAPPPAAAPSAPPPSAASVAANAPLEGKSGGWGLGDIRGWLVQKIIGVPPNATVAKTGEKLTAYYDEKQKRWIFPGEPVDAGPGNLAGPPIIPPAASGEAAAPTQKQPGPSNAAPGPPAPRPGGVGGLKNRYVIAS